MEQDIPLQHATVNPTDQIRLLREAITALVVASTTDATAKLATAAAPATSNPTASTAAADATLLTGAEAAPPLASSASEAAADYAGRRSLLLLATGYTKMLQDKTCAGQAPPAPDGAAAVGSQYMALDKSELVMQLKVAAAENTRMAHEKSELEKQLKAAQRALAEEQLLAALAQPMGFHNGKPLAALVLFRASLHWGAFQADRTSLFDRINQLINDQIERQQDTTCRAYWLTITTTLLHLLERHIKPASGSSSQKGVAAAEGSCIGSLFDRQTMGGEAPIHGGGVGGFRMVEAKYPALLFKRQLHLFMWKIPLVMRDNLMKEIRPMLRYCIYTSHGTYACAGAGSRRATSAAAAGSGPGATGAAASAPSTAWSNILAVFDELLAKLRENHVLKPLVQVLFKQLFHFMIVELFNRLLLQRECCSFSNGEYVKAGLAQVESWIMEHGIEWVGESWEELKFIRQAVTFLLVGNKPTKTLENITQDLCPVLSLQQLYRISTLYSDDKYNTETVSSEVLGRMKQAMVEDSSSNSASFLLDHGSVLPYEANNNNNILAHMDDKGLYMPLPVPQQLKLRNCVGATSFAFLEKELCCGQM